jgi:hypothetical protein
MTIGKVIGGRHRDRSIPASEFASSTSCAHCAAIVGIRKILHCPVAAGLAPSSCAEVTGLAFNTALLVRLHIVYDTLVAQGQLISG